MEKHSKFLLFWMNKSKEKRLRSRVFWSLFVLMDFIVLGSLLFYSTGQEMNLLWAKSESETGGRKQKTNLEQKFSVEENLGKVPLYFIPNKGQVAQEVDFYSVNRFSKLFFNEGETVIVFTKINQSKDDSYQTAFDLIPSKQPSEEVIVRKKLVGAKERVGLKYGERLPGKINYLIGNDPSKWITDIEIYNSMKYEEIYQGIDLVYYGSRQNQIEYDFIVKSKADYHQIKIEYQNIDEMQVNENGDIIIKLKDFEIVEKRPHIYQEKDGQKFQINGHFKIIGNSVFTFEIESYDKNLPLIIDPHLAYSTYLGGSGYENANSGGIAYDSSGYYILGDTDSTNYPTTIPSACPGLSGTFCGNDDVVITKLNPSGTALIFSTYLGGTSTDYASNIVVQSQELFITGSTNSANFPTTAGAYDTALNSSDTFYVAKINSLGNSILYSTFVEGSGIDGPNDMKVVSGQMYIAGQTYSTNFPTTPGAYDTTHGANSKSDCVLFKINPLGAGNSDLVFSTFLGGTDTDLIFSMDVDSLGNIYVHGRTSSSTGEGFPVTAGAYDTIFNPSAAGTDTFIAKFNSNASSLLYSTYYGGTNSQTSREMAVDNSGYVYVSGWTASTNFPTTPGAYRTTPPGAGVTNDIYIGKFNLAGGGASDLLYSTYFGGTAEDRNYGLALDGNSVVIVGFTRSTNLPTTPGAYDLTQGPGDPNGYDAYAAVFDLNGAGVSDLRYSTYFGGNGMDWFASVIVPASGQLIIGGNSYSSNLPITDPTYDSTLDTSISIFNTDFVIVGLNINAPTKPTSLYSNNTNAQAGQINPLGITDTTPVFSAICNDPNAGDILNKYQIQVDDNNNFSSLIWDSGAAGTSMANCVVGSRSQDIEFGGAPITLNGTAYYWRIKFWDDDGNEGDWSEVWASTNYFVMANVGVTQAWTAGYNGPNNGNDWGNNVAVDNLGNVYVTGNSVGVGTQTDLTTIKYDSAGNQVWINRYDGPASGNDYGRVLAVDNAGNVYVTGSSNGVGTALDCTTIKYDSAGNQVWIDRYNGPGGSGDEGLGMALDNLGNVYVTGWSNGLGTLADYVTIKYNSGGTQQWVSRYNGLANSNENARDVFVDNSGNVYVTGWSNGIGTQSDYATIKYDNNGNELWVARYNGAGNSNDDGYDVTVDSSGFVYVTGKSYGGAGSGYDAVTIKYNSAGVQQWIAQYNGPNSTYDDAYDIALDSSLNVYVLSSSEGVGTGSDYAVIKYDNNGNQLWVSRYNGLNNTDDYAYAMAVSSDGNVYVTGSSNWGNDDYTTIKYDTNGNQLWLMHYNGPANNYDAAYTLNIDSNQYVYISGESTNLAGNSDWLTIKYTQPLPNNTPTAPTLLYSDNSSAQSGQINPTNLNDSSPAFSALCNDPDAGDILNKYRIQVDDNNDFSSVVWDSGAAGTNITNCIAGSRSSDVEYAGSALNQDGTKYYWRIKFWDDSNAEGAWSENPISTNFFQIVAAGLPQAFTAPSPPLIGTPQATSPTAIRWYFTDTSGNEIGFELRDNLENQIIRVATSNLEYLEETGLNPNTQYGGRKVFAFNDGGYSAPSEEAASIFTLANIPAIQSVASADIDKIKVIINLNSNPDYTEMAVRELTTNKFVQADGTLGDNIIWQVYKGTLNQASFYSASLGQADWNGDQGFEVTGLNAGTEYTFQVKARNGDNIETDFSSSVSGKTFEAGEPVLSLDLSVGINTGPVETAAVITTNQTLNLFLSNLPEISFYASIIILALLLEFVFSSFIVLNNLKHKNNKRKTLRIVTEILLKDPVLSFYLHAPRKKDGTYLSNFCLHKKYQEVASTSFGALIMFLVVKVVLMTAIGLYVSSQVIAAPAPYLDNSKEVKYGDELTYRIGYVNTGSGKATSAVITAPIPGLTEYLTGSLNLNGLGQTDIADSDQADYNQSNSNSVTFKFGTIDKEEGGYIIYRVKINQKPTEETSIINQAKIVYAENENPVFSNQTSNLIKPVTEEKPEEKPPEVKPPEVKPPEVEKPEAKPPEIKPSEAPAREGVHPVITPLPTPGEVTLPSGEGKALGEKAAPEITGAITEAAQSVVISGKSTPLSEIIVFMAGRQFTATSDEEGNWSISVLKNVLVLDQQYSVQVKAQKEGVSSERIDLGKIFLTAGGKLIITPPGAKGVSLTNLINAFREAVIKVEPGVQASLIAAVPIITILNPIVFSNAPNIFAYLYHLISWLLSVLGIKKRRKPWGTVYDAITKDPISLAIVRLIDSASNKLIETQVTDKDGRFAFIPKIGKYFLEVIKPKFIYPSKIIEGKEDLGYFDIYRKGVIEINNLEQAIICNIPLDPQDQQKMKAEAKLFRTLWLNVTEGISLIALPVMIVGTIASLLITLADATSMNIIIFLIYILFTLFQITFQPSVPRPWGRVFDTNTIQAVPLTQISIIDAQYNRVLKTRLTDYQGRYSFLPPAGKYKLLVQKLGFNYPSVKKEMKSKEFKNTYFGQEFEISKKKPIINADVPVDPVE